MADQTAEQYVVKVESLRAEIEALRDGFGFSRNDMRRAYFSNVSRSLEIYASSMTLLHLAQIVGKSEFTVIEQQRPKVIRDSIIPRVVSTLFQNYNGGGPTLWNEYIGKLKGHLFHDVWASLEDALRRIYHSDAVPLAQRQEDEAAEKGRFKTEPRRVHLSVSTVIWKRLAAQTKANGTTSKQRAHHFAAVDFFSVARNTIHSNTFYEGEKERTLRLGQETLKLVPGEPLSFSFPDTMLMIVRRLADAFAFLCANIKHDVEITSPVSLRNPAKDWPAPKRNLDRARG